MQSELLLGFQRDRHEPGRRAERANLVKHVGAHVSVAYEIRKRHFRAVHEPQDGRRGRVVAKMGNAKRGAFYQACDLIAVLEEASSLEGIRRIAAR